MLDPRDRMPLPNGLLELTNRNWLALQLGFDGTIGQITDIPPDPETAGLVANELPEAHALHPADEPEPDSYRGHAGVPPDVK